MTLIETIQAGQATERELINQLVAKMNDQATKLQAALDALAAGGDPAALQAVADEITAENAVLTAALNPAPPAVA